MVDWSQNRIKLAVILHNVQGWEGDSNVEREGAAEEMSRGAVGKSD